jgi:hypothetical protein
MSVRICLPEGVMQNIAIGPSLRGYSGCRSAKRLIEWIDLTSFPSR